VLQRDNATEPYSHLHREAAEDVVVRIVVVRPNPVRVPADSLRRRSRDQLCIQYDPVDIVMRSAIYRVSVARVKVPDVIAAVARLRRPVAPIVALWPGVHHSVRPCGVIEISGLPASRSRCPVAVGPDLGFGRIVASE
jgi:hypothetical protein